MHQALKRFGGFVRYFDTTEPLPKLAELVASGPSRDVLVCCGGGNQALTILGATAEIHNLWAADINPAQLFILAAKASFLKQKKIMPSFKELQKIYPGRIAAIQRDIRHLKQMQLCHTGTGEIMTPPAVLGERYALVLDGAMFVLPDSGPYWQNDKSFISRLRTRIRHLRFLKIDIFDSPDYFKPASLDLIYMSDIYWLEALPYYQEKLRNMTRLLRSEGRILFYLDPGDDFMGRGISPGRILVKQARELALTIEEEQDGGYLVLKKIKKK